MFFAAATPMCRAVSGEPVNDTRRTPGWATRAAPISSPIPCTMLNTPGGKPASSTRSARSEHESGDHSAGLRIIVEPGRERRRGLPRGEHERRVPRRDHDGRPARHPDHAVVGAVRIPHPLLVGDGEVGIAAVVACAPVDQSRLQRAQQHRHVDALDRRQPLDVGVDQVGEAMQVDGPPGGAEGGPGRERLGRRGHGQVGLALPTARDLAERLLVDRREVRERAGARDALAPDEVVRRDLDTGHGDPLGHATPSNARAPASTVVTPPSTGITAPLTYEASSESSHATVPAISAGELGRRDGTSAVALAYASSREPPAPARERVHRAVGHRRPNPARADAVRPQARRAVVDCDALGQHRERGLRGAVGEAGGRGAQARDGRDGDDCAASLEQVRDRRPGDQKRSGEVDANHVLECFRREVEEGALATDPGVDDERVDARRIAPPSRRRPCRRPPRCRCRRPRPAPRSLPRPPRSAPPGGPSPRPGTRQRSASARPPRRCRCPRP